MRRSEPRVLSDGRLDPRPLFRGVLHRHAALASVVGGLVLLALAGSARARLAAATYGLGLTAMFSVSAVYHSVWWHSRRVRERMRRLDHSTITLTIAGTYTPFGLLVLEDPIATLVLAFVWVGALSVTALNIVWAGAPRWASAISYTVVGWAGVVALPQMLENAGALVTVLVIIGGVLYSAGALVYARRRPDPLPASFGYHELFHLLVVAAAGVQFVAVAVVLI